MESFGLSSNTIECRRKVEGIRMRRKCILGGMCVLVVLGMTACASTISGQVTAQEADEVVVKEEPEVATTQKPSEPETTVTETKQEQEVTTETKQEEKNVQETLKEEIPGADGKVDESDFAAEVNGVIVKIGEDINLLLDELGEADDLIEAQSCLHDGMDKIYTYGGISIYTYPDNDKDIVNIIEYNGDEKTLSDIGLGSTRADIEEAYGTDFEMDSTYITYSYKENATISFMMDGEECAYIELYWE